MSTTINPNYHEFALMLDDILGIAPNMVSNAAAEGQAFLEHSTDADGAWTDNNPWDTTLNVAPNNTVNSVGVRSFWSQLEGVYANVVTARTIMPTVIQGIQAADASIIFSAQGLAEYDTWGGRSGYGLDVQQIYNEIMNGQLV